MNVSGQGEVRERREQTASAEAGLAKRNPQTPTHRHGGLRLGL